MPAAEAKHDIDGGEQLIEGRVADERVGGSRLEIPGGKAGVEKTGWGEGRSNGGEGGIRTHGRVPPTLAFEASSFNRSDTSPRGLLSLA